MLKSRHRRTIRGPVNPLDKATIVSILPKAIKEEKITITPGIFEIPAGSPSSPQLLVVGPSSWWKDVGIDQPIIEIPNWSTQIAESFVKDYCSGLLMVDMEENMPGLFHIPGSITLTQLRAEYAEQLKIAERKQINWFNALMRLADAGWALTNGNPTAISADMRMAAKELGVKRSWTETTATNIPFINCIACGALRNPQYPICGVCHQVVDRELAVKLGLLELPKAAKAG